MTFGFSRDDAGKFLDAYYDAKIYESDPLPAWIRPASVLWSRWPPKRAAPPAPTSKLGICGEHGGDPSSVEFCHNIGLNYVSCSPSGCRSPVWPPPRLPSRKRERRNKVVFRSTPDSKTRGNANSKKTLQGNPCRVFFVA